jgi:magnesium transporter
VQLRDLIGRIAAGQGRLVDDFKRISSWAAILFAPTLVGTIYGMNFRRMPELGWSFGYPFAIGLMGVICAGLYVIFKRRDWL